MSTNRPDLEIRRQVAAFVVEEMAFEEFEDWFLEHTWGTHDTDLQDLIAAVELPVAEFTGGYMTESELRDRLRPLVVDYSAPLLWPAPGSTAVRPSGGTVVVQEDLTPAGA